MAIVTGVGTSWSLPNYSGELFTADPVQTPLLSMIGGLTGGMITRAYEFVTAQLFNHPAVTQPNISEDDSIIAPPPAHIVREQVTNVVQIHHETIDLTYVKLANSGLMSGVNIAGQQANPPNEFDWQLQQKLVKIARDIEWSFIAGQFQRATSSGVANMTRGMLEVTQLPGGSHIDAAGAPLDKDMLNTLFRTMADGGAMFQNPVMFVGAYLKQKITEIYNLVVGFALPPTRNIGGLNIQEIEFDFGRMGIVWSRFMPPDALLVADVSYMAPVFQEVPGKGILFTEPLAKIGASEREQLFTQVGLDSGPSFLHGSITGILNPDANGNGNGNGTV